MSDGQNKDDALTPSQPQSLGRGKYFARIVSCFGRDRVQRQPAYITDPMVCKRVNEAAVMQTAPELRESAYGWLTIAAQTMKMSKSTASRDFALGRRIHSQFVRIFGRALNPEHDQVVWSWDWSHYGFRTRESCTAGHRKPVGHFPFAIRCSYTNEDAYCGFNAQSWSSESGSFGGWNRSDLRSALQLINRLKTL